MSIKYNKIILFSPPRSGSTLLYNILKNTINNYEICKSHIFEYDINNLYIITIRHPYNSMISIGLCNKINIFNINTIDNIYNNYMNYGGNCLINNNFEHDNIIILRYETFFNNYNYIYNILEQKLNIKIPQLIRNEVSDTVSIKNVKKNIEKFKNFKEYDELTHYHGNHISLYEGETNYLNILSSENIIYLNSIKNINFIITKFSY